MTPTEFREWLARCGLTEVAAAEALGMSRRMVSYYKSGAKVIPKRVELACAAICSMLLQGRDTSTISGAPDR